MEVNVIKTKMRKLSLTIGLLGLATFIGNTNSVEAAITADELVDRVTTPVTIGNTNYASIPIELNSTEFQAFTADESIGEVATPVSISNLRSAIVQFFPGPEFPY